MPPEEASKLGEGDHRRTESEYTQLARTAVCAMVGTLFIQPGAMSTADPLARSQSASVASLERTPAPARCDALIRRLSSFRVCFRGFATAIVALAG